MSSYLFETLVQPGCSQLIELSHKGFLATCVKILIDDIRYDALEDL